MNIEEKLASYDRGGEPRLHIFIEGLFAKLYNESAYLFVRHIHAYKVNVTESKRGRYYSIGFPASRLGELLGECPDCELHGIEDGYRTCTCPSLCFDESAYADWCREATRAAEEETARKAARKEARRVVEGESVGVPDAAGTPASGYGNGGMSETSAAPFGAAVNGVSVQAVPVSDPLGALRPVLAEIQRFRIDSATPMECMLFLQSVQRKLYGTIPEPAGL